MENIIFPDPEKVRLQKEFDEIDRRVQAILLGLGYFCKKTWGIPIMIVCLIRSVEENAKIGGRENSAHLPHRRGAADIRIFYLTDEQVAAIKKYLLDTWGADFICVVTLEHGTGPHIHLNINFKHLRKEALPELEKA